MKKPEQPGATSVHCTADNSTGFLGVSTNTEGGGRTGVTSGTIAGGTTVTCAGLTTSLPQRLLRLRFASGSSDDASILWCLSAASRQTEIKLCYIDGLKQ